MILEPRSFASESIHDSTNTKSLTKLGIEHLKMASFPTIMLSGEILISYRWLVTEKKVILCINHSWKIFTGFPKVYIFNAIFHKTNQCTLITKIKRRRTKDICFWINPGVDKNKIRHKTRDWAFEYCIIADNDTLPQNVNFISLRCH